MMLDPIHTKCFTSMSLVSLPVFRSLGRMTSGLTEIEKSLCKALVRARTRTEVAMQSCFGNRAGQVLVNL
jgi:hypothetical protein